MRKWLIVLTASARRRRARARARGLRRRRRRRRRGRHRRGHGGRGRPRAAGAGQAARSRRDIPYAPFEFTEPGSTEAIGFDVDLVKAIAATPGIGITDVEFIKQPFDTIILSVSQGRFDMSASSFSITPERAKQIDFSDPYFIGDPVGDGPDRTPTSRASTTCRARRSAPSAAPPAPTSPPPSRGPRSPATRSSTTPSTRSRPAGLTRVINDFAVSAYAAAQARRLQDRGPEPHHRELRPGVPEGEPGAARRLQRRPRRDQGERDLRRDLPQVVRRGAAGAGEDPLAG